ncbi:hypothetical protein NQ314_001933 [Rhamnusium bicolor]|uniref:Transposase n=1 Tax=Rhamnusium bicolor TaxID=1586634 RepID=A0AAV8ZQP9_9CUCU|nr:hypothetical protein NQ314_001933 [Rhamnusium bicolor]
MDIFKNLPKYKAQVTPEMINEYFNNLSVTLEGVPPKLIINYDETNLADDPGHTKIIWKRGTKYPEGILNHAKTAISVLFSATADGTMLPPYVIYKVTHLYHLWM